MNTLFHLAEDLLKPMEHLSLAGMVAWIMSPKMIMPVSGK